MTFLILFLGVIAGVVAYLIFSGDNGATFGIMHSELAPAILMSMWGALVASAIIPRRGQLREFARNAVLWLAIILLLVGGYVYRFELQDMASRLSAGLIPGTARVVEIQDGRNRVVLSRGLGNHFVANMELDGTNLRMLVDTGATTTVLTQAAAEAVGIDTDTLRYSIPTSTANGIAYAARARVEEVSLGPIRRERLSVLVAQPGALRESLLGMNFLNSLYSFEFRGDELFITD